MTKKPKTIDLRGTSFAFYYVDELGRVFSTKRGSLRRLRTDIDRAGYERVEFRVQKGKSVLRKKLFVHRLVAEAFLRKTRAKKAFVCHINGKRRDNRASNLSWRRRGAR